MRTNPAPQAPLSSTTVEVTGTATSALGGGIGGVYEFIVTGPYSPGTDDLEAVTIWMTFGKSPSDPVAESVGVPVPPFVPYRVVLGDGIKFKAIRHTTTMNLTWSLLSAE